MIESLIKSTSLVDEKCSVFSVPENGSKGGNCQSVLHNMPPGVTVGGFCSYDGGTTYRVRLKQFKGGKHFSQVCAYYRSLYESIPAGRDRKRSAIGLCSDGDFSDCSFGECSYRKAAYRELLYFPYDEQPPCGDVFVYRDFRIVFDCHIGDGLYPFRQSLCNAVVIFSWRMFDCVSSLVEAYKIVEMQLNKLGFKIREYSLRRVDINLTTPRVSIQTVSDAFRELRFNTLAHKVGTFGGKKGTLETLYIGKTGSSVLFRAYDKTKELQDDDDKYDAQLKSIAIFSKLGLNTVSQITRLEFELNAKFFKDSNISTFDELEKQMKSVITYLFRDWLRFLQNRRETYGHKSREKIADWWNWSRIQFEQWAESLSEEQTNFRRESHDIETGAHLEAQAKNFLLHALAEYKRVNPGLDARELADELVSLLEVVQIPRWGGAMTKKELIMNYHLECSKVLREKEREREWKRRVAICEDVRTLEVDYVPETFRQSQTELSLFQTDGQGISVSENGSRESAA